VTAAGPPVEETHAPDVAFVVPSPAYEAIDTEAEAGPAPALPPEDDEDEEDLDLSAESFLPPPPPAREAEAPRLSEAVRELGETLGRKLDGLQTLFDREIRAEATREKVVDRLHAELQEYKQDLLLKVLRPVFVDLIQLHDDIGKMVEAHAGPEAAVARLLDVMRGFQQGIEDILYRQGVEPFHSPDGAFDPRRQRAVATVPTDDPGQNKTIAARHRKGFEAGDKVIRPEIVSVFAFKK
jgi:molecular chaperone GrpE